LTGQAPLGGNHYGGSAQIGFSTDKGKTFRTVVSYEGNCPHRHGGESPDGQTFPFTVPQDLPSGDVVFAWVWYNREQEFFMNCAAVTITGGSGTAAAAEVQQPQAPAPAAVQNANANYGSNPTPDSSTNTDTNPAADTSSDSQPSPVADSSNNSPPTTPAAPAKQTFEMLDCTCTCPPGMSSSKFKRDYKLTGCFCECPTTHAAQRLRRSNPDLAVVEKRGASTVAFTSRPLMFIADPKHGCDTPHTSAELKFPDPGPDVVQGDGEYPLALPGGTCMNPSIVV
jgi:hypothetical protein